MYKRQGLAVGTLHLIDEKVLVEPANIVAVCLLYTSHAAGRQHTLKLTDKGVIAYGTGAVKALLLPQEQLVHIQLTAHQLRQHIGLKLPQG